MAVVRDGRTLLDCRTLTDAEVDEVAAAVARCTRMSERSSEALLWDFLRGAMMTKALGMVADLRIADALADGPRSVEEIAREGSVDADVLHRVLRALASDGVFAEEEPGVFRNTAVSELLLSPGWAEFAHLFGGVFYEAARDLEVAARTGTATFPDAFGDDFWTWLGARAGERGAFDRAMAGERWRKAERLAELDWKDGQTVVDVGGGNGALLLDLFRRRPGLHGIVFDLPETNRDESELGEHIEFVEGNFFDSVPPGEAYVLSAIIHDWDDRTCGDDPSEHPRRGGTGGARPDRRIRHSAGKRGGRREMARPADARPRRWQGADGDRMAALLDGAGLEPVSIEDGLIEARCP